MRWIEIRLPNYRVIFDVLHQHAKSGEDGSKRAGCRCENIVFVSLFLSRSVAGALFVREERRLNGAATLHRATLDRATVKRRQFTGRQLTEATINQSDR